MLDVPSALPSCPLSPFDIVRILLSPIAMIPIFENAIWLALVTLTFLCASSKYPLFESTQCFWSPDLQFSGPLKHVDAWSWHRNVWGRVDLARLVSIHTYANTTPESHPFTPMSLAHGNMDDCGQPTTVGEHWLCICNIAVSVRELCA